jgi:hypothetical protein
MKTRLAALAVWCVAALALAAGAAADDAGRLATPRGHWAAAADSAARDSAAADSAARDSAAMADSAARDSAAESILVAEPDSSVADAPPEDAPADRDYEVERSSAVAPSEVEVGYSLASLARGGLSQRRRVQLRETNVQAEMREGRGDALAGAALSSRVPGGWLSLGRAAPRWGRGLLVGTPAEPWRTGTLVAETAAARPREGDALEFRRPGALALDVVAAHVRRDAFAAASLGLGAAALELAVTRALDDPVAHGLVGLRLAGGGAEAEAALDAHGSWRLELVRRAASHHERGAARDASHGTSRDAELGTRHGGLSLAMRLGHYDFHGVQRPRVAPPAAALGASLEGAPRRGLEARMDGSCWRFPGGQTAHRGALEVSADMAQHESIAMGLEERQGARRLSAGATAASALRQGVWAEWRRGGPGLAMNLRHEWWGRAGGLRERTRELASAELESRPLPGCSASLTVWLYRTSAADPQYVTDTEIDRTVWRALPRAGHRTRVRVGFPAAGGSVRAAITVSESGGRAPPPQWTLDWTRRARTR